MGLDRAAGRGRSVHRCARAICLRPRPRQGVPGGSAGVQEQRLEAGQCPFADLPCPGRVAASRARPQWDLRFLSTYSLATSKRCARAPVRRRHRPTTHTQLLSASGGRDEEVGNSVVALSASGRLRFLLRVWFASQKVAPFTIISGVALGILALLIAYCYTLPPSRFASYSILPQQEELPHERD